VLCLGKRHPKRVVVEEIVVIFFPANGPGRPPRVSSEIDTLQGQASAYL